MSQADKTTFLTFYHLRKFAAEIKKFMIISHITQTELGLRMGKNATSINSVLNKAQNVELKTLVALAEAAGLDLRIEITPKTKS